MEDRYGLKDITPVSMQCTLVSCPSIYELEEITPESVRSMQCMLGSCSSIYEDKEGKEVYIIIGKKLDPKAVGLEKKVGEGEVLIEIPKGLLANLKRD